MQRPFEGIRIIDITHVLAGPFAAYQLGLMGADVIKVEDPNDPDQSRDSGTDNELNHAGMGTGFLTQGSNKRAITLNLKSEEGRDILKKLVATADVLVENYRPGAFEALGLGYEDLRKINPRLIYASFSAFGQTGPKRERTAYDHVIQSTSGIMASTGSPTENPIKIGAPAIDYATGTMGAFALSAALFQREKTGQGQRIDMAMLDVALMLQASLATGYLRNGVHPKPNGNKMAHATSQAYHTKDGMLMIGASNMRQQARLWKALEHPEMVKTTNDERHHDYETETKLLASLMLGRTAAEWEEWFQERHVPASRVRTMGEALADPQIASRGLLHKHHSAPGVKGSFTVPVAAFKFAHGGPKVDRAPPMFGQHNEEILATLGYGKDDLARLRAAKVI